MKAPTHMWGCSHRFDRSGRLCGRESQKVWCRTQGGGHAFISMCPRHEGWSVHLGNNVADFIVVALGEEFDEFLRARKVRSNLLTAAQREARDAQYISLPSGTRIPLKAPK